jgi:hypothetical protein
MSGRCPAPPLAQPGARQRPCCCRPPCCPAESGLGRRTAAARVTWRPSLPGQAVGRGCGPIGTALTALPGAVRRLPGAVPQLAPRSVVPLGCCPASPSPERRPGSPAHRLSGADQVPHRPPVGPPSAPPAAPPPSGSSHAYFVNSFTIRISINNKISFTPCRTVMDLASMRLRHYHFRAPRGSPDHSLKGM